MSVIVGFQGRRGDGKTLAMTAALALSKRRGHETWTNYHVGWDHQPLTVDAIIDFADAESGLVNAAVGVDEIHVWLDSRLSGTKRNRIASYMISQTRKRSVDFFYTTQFFHQVEKRIRDNTDIMVSCTNLNRERDIGKPVSEQNPDIMLTIVDRGAGKFYRKRIPPARARRVGAMYDTNQVIAFA